MGRPAPTTASSSATTGASRCAAAPKRAIVAVAHKMLRVLYAVLTTGTPYRDPQTDYEAIMVRRNAPRWIAMLQAHGIDPVTGEPLVQPAA